MPTSLPSEITSSAPTLSTAIFSTASYTDWSGVRDRIRLLSLLFSTNAIVSVSFMMTPPAGQDYTPEGSRSDRSWLVPNVISKDDILKTTALRGDSGNQQKVPWACEFCLHGDISPS